MDIDLEIYKQCNEHLKETDRKRDQLVAAFAVVVGVVISNKEKLEGEWLEFSLLGLGIAGILVILAIVQYRKWHIVYVRCSQLMEFYIRATESHGSAKLSAIVADYASQLYKKSRWSWLNPLGSTEAAVFLFVVTIAFAPWQLLAIENGGLWPLHSCMHYLPDILNYMGFTVLTHCVLFIVLSHADKQDPFGHWILRSLKKSLDEPNGSNEEMPKT